MTSPMTPPQAAPGPQSPVTAPTGPTGGGQFPPPAGPAHPAPPQQHGQPQSHGGQPAPQHYAQWQYAEPVQQHAGHPGQASHVQPTQHQPGVPLGGDPSAGWIAAATPTPGPVRVPDANAKARKLAGWAAVGGAVLVVLGSVLPWASVAFVGSIYGTDGDGIITLVCAVIAALLVLPFALGKGRGWMLGVAAFFGLISAAVAAYDLSNISAFASDESLVSVGPGLPIIIAGGLVVIGASVFGLIKGKHA